MHDLDHYIFENEADSFILHWYKVSLTHYYYIIDCCVTKLGYYFPLESVFLELCCTISIVG